MHRLDTFAGQWDKLKVAGLAPEPRSGHVAEFIGEKLFVMGGISRGESLDDLVYLDTRHMHWCQPRTSHPPRPRAQHAAAVVGTSLMVFGGSQGGTFFGDLATLDVKSRTTRVSLVRFSED